MYRNISHVGTSPVKYRLLDKGKHRVSVVARCPGSEPDAKRFKFEIP